MADGGHIRSVKTTCPYCGVGCGVVVEQKTGPRVVDVRGDEAHPANRGRLCSKGLALGQTLGLTERLAFPEINGARASWDAATSHIASEFSRIIKAHGPDAVSFYVSGQLLTEDYYVANKLMKGFIGSGNIDTNSRLCMASSVAGHKRAFGADTVPGCYEDLELADLVILTGSNFAWCHPVLFQRLLAEKEARPSLKIVVIDPRRTATTEFADLHLNIRPGGDVTLFAGLLKSLEARGLRDHQFVKAHTNGVDQALEAAAPFDVTRVAQETALRVDDVNAFYKLFAETEKAVTVYSQGVNQASDGSDRVNAIINCHLLTGRIGKPGLGPFSITGQPNAMGGREVGGLANQLASHMAIENSEDRDRVQRFWRAPRIADKPGLKAVDLFNAIHEGKVKAVWIMATNPVVSMPNADFVRSALQKCELVVVSDVMAETDTGACAHIRLPSTAWGEKQGMVTNSERCMSRQRAFVEGPGEARDDWRQFCDVAKKMGYEDAFDYQTVGDVFREYAALCAFENDGDRDLDLSGAADLSAAQYRDFTPRQWPIVNDSPTPDASKRLFADGRFFHEDGRARFVAIEPRAAAPVDPDYPLTLNTGRIRDQWHTLTRTGLAAKLFDHMGEPYVEISEQDAKAAEINHAEIAELISPFGRMRARAVITDRQTPGRVFAPMHWTDQYANNARVDALVAANPDPISGQPALKASKARLERFEARWFGFAAGLVEGDRAPARPAAAGYAAWARFPLTAVDSESADHSGWRMELAGRDVHQGRSLVDHLFADFLGDRAARVEVVSLGEGADSARSAFAAFDGDQLAAFAFFDRQPVSVARSWACEQIGRVVSGSTRLQFLAGRPGADAPDKGAIVCSCLSVGANDIKRAVAGGCRSVSDVTDATGAGGNCGSCRSEIRRFLGTTVDA